MRLPSGTASSPFGLSGPPRPTPSTELSVRPPASAVLRRDTLGVVVDSTLSDVFVDRAGGARALRRQTVLTIAFRADDPLEPPSRHLLEDTDVVHFRRGDRSATRDQAEGLRRLLLRVPDPVMSADHGRLLYVSGEWLLEDPRSKNGSVVNGRPTRLATVHTGDMLELGHTLFLLEAAELPANLPRDAMATEVLPRMATLHVRLAQDLEMLSRVAATDVPILLLGETGTGKEVLARAVHQRSGRHGRYVAVNCGGLAPSLMEAELFGHRRGAFSGAVADRPGYLRTADGGTLFLDEVAELPPPAQAALLRALQQREVVPVGDSNPVGVDVRVCAATNRNLVAMVAAGAFREDLYARLLGVKATLPPLRERRGDLGLLIAAVLKRLPGGDRARFVPAAAHALFCYGWPLNVRELERCLAAALVLADGDPIDVEHLPPDVAVPKPPPAERAGPAAAEDDEQLRGQLIELLRRHHGNVAAVARDLGKHREQIHRWARRFGIDLDSFRK